MTDNQRYINELKKRITQLEFLVELQNRELKEMRKHLAFNAIDEWLTKNNEENDE